MNRTITQLLETMNDELRDYRAMQAILSQEREAATRSDKEQLMRVCQTKQDLVQRLSQTEDRRAALVEGLAEQCGIQDRPLTIGRLSACVDTPDASRLKAKAEELKRLVEAVQLENNANARLFSQALELVHGSLKLINALIYSSAIYRKPGLDHRMQGYAGDRGKVFCSSV